MARLAFQWHPDYSKEKGAESRFSEIVDAHRILNHRNTLAAHDQLGWPEPEQQPSYQNRGQAIDLDTLIDHFNSTSSSTAVTKLEHLAKRYPKLAS